jgi:hypothetical protein
MDTQYELVKSSQVNTLPNAKSQAKVKRAKDRQKYAALRCKVGVAPPGFDVRRRISRVAFRVFPAGRAGDTRAARKEAHFRLLDLARLNELFMRSSFDLPKGH